MEFNDSAEFILGHRAASNGVPGGWTADEDRLLLLGVAALGAGRWTEIRQHFMLDRNSAQMNQRFTRLASRRTVFVDLTAREEKDAENKSAGWGPQKSATSHSDGGASGPSEEHAAEQHIEGQGRSRPSVEGAERNVRTRYVQPEEERLSRSRLPTGVRELLERYSEETIWDSVAVRHLAEAQNGGWRSGRPQKYPVPIPIPTYMLNGAWVNFTALLIERPAASGSRTSSAGAAVNIIEEYSECEDDSNSD
jgi:hypothetical protein